MFTLLDGAILTLRLVMAAQSSLGIQTACFSAPTFLEKFRADDVDAFTRPADRRDLGDHVEFA